MRLPASANDRSEFPQKKAQTAGASRTWSKRMAKGAHTRVTGRCRAARAGHPFRPHRNCCLASACSHDAAPRNSQATGTASGSGISSTCKKRRASDAWPALAPAGRSAISRFAANPSYRRRSRADQPVRTGEAAPQWRAPNPEYSTNARPRGPYRRLAATSQASKRPPAPHPECCAPNKRSNSRCGIISGGGARSCPAQLMLRCMLSRRR